MENKTGAYLVAIVALVAIVGLILMFTGKSTTDSTTYVVDDEGNAYTVDDQGNIAGQAFRISGISRVSSIIKGPTTKPRCLSGCYDDDGKCMIVCPVANE